MLDLKTLKLTSIEKEIFVDFLPDRREFMVYLIDNIRRKVIPYSCKYIPDTVSTISSKGKQFNVDRIGTYGKDDYMCIIYKELSLTDFYIIDRIDIYNFRMELHPSIRNRTNPIYYYELLEYEFIPEDDYLKLQ